jgi:hypothetical protein
MELIDPVLFRGTERIIVVLGAVFFAYLGYRLFLFGVDKGRGKLEVESEVFKVIFSGSGPGLFFMAFGSVVLIFSLFFGGAKTSSVSDLEKKGMLAAISELNENITAHLSHFTPIMEDYEDMQKREIDRLYAESNQRFIDLQAIGGLDEEEISKINQMISDMKSGADEAVNRIEKQTELYKVQQTELLKKHEEFELLLAQFESKIIELK